MEATAPHWFVIGYFTFALLVSVYQAYRGFMLQWILGVQPTNAARRIILLCLADMFTYFVCTLSGFIALANLGVRESQAPFSAPEATWRILLATVGVLGVTGKLPEMLTKIKVPGAGD